jgi:hypothetical protein
MIICYFSTELPSPFLKGEADERMIDIMVDLWVNFATFHDPTPSLESKAYLVLKFI